MTTTDLRIARRRLARTLLMTATLLLASPAVAQGGAQGGGAPHPLRIALLENAPADAPLGLVVRSGAAREPDLLVLPADRATAQLVRAGIAFAKKFRRDVRHVDGTAVATLGGYVQRRRGGPANERAQRHAEEVLARARTQPVVNIGNLGRGRWVELDVANVEP